ncbi:MAG: GAF domain-containing protein, partial [Lysobacteraceae bacterium]
MLPADCDKLMSAPAAFLSGGGEMGALMRVHDWDATGLGEPAGWPTALKTTLRLLLTSNHPMLIWWGPELIQFYNDAYRATLDAERHPLALGQRGRACWEEAWPIIGPQIAQVMGGGGATWHEHQLVPLVREGVLTDAWWTYGYSPIEDDSGVRGLLVLCNDVTEEQRNRMALLELNRRLEEEIAQRTRAQSELAAAKMRSDVALAVSENQLERQLGDWQQLHAMSERLLDERTVQGQFDIVLRTVTGLHGSHQGVISLFDADAGGLVTQASQGISDAGRAALRCVPPGAGACGTAFRDKRRVIVADTDSEPVFADYRGFARAEGIKALYTTPFFSIDGSALGVLSVYFHDQREPDEREIQLTDICARHLAPIVERERARAQLHFEQEQSEQRRRLYETFLSNTPDLAYVFDLEHRFTYANEVLLTMWGRSWEESIGKTCLELGYEPW